MKVAVIYWTNTGNTEQMAEEIALGARDAGADITLTAYADTTPAEALQADQLILGMVDQVGAGTQRCRRRGCRSAVVLPRYAG